MEVKETDPEAGLVHLDLKGAPPKIAYFEKLFPLLRQWGATGLLVEYEDMFPYWGPLQHIAAHNAYSPSEIQVLLQLAAASSLIVIPLVQTFGHFEFVLKHDKFKHLREVPSFPMTLCPLNQESVQLVCQMIDQVVQLHPDIASFHIGADEVFHLGYCKLCKKPTNDRKSTKMDMFFSHIRNVLVYIKDKYPHLGCIMWDDMFRDIALEDLQKYELGSLVEPMVWCYHRNLNLPENMWDIYSQEFEGVWVASAFKGATGPCMFAVDISYHIQNHREWLKTVAATRDKFKHFRGYCVTGWQRYDHYAVLCELFPAGLPSLAVCLLTLDRGSFQIGVHKQASLDLKFDDLLPLNPFQSVGILSKCQFPGSEIYNGIQLYLSLKTECKRFLKNERLCGWMSDYHVRYKYTNPAHVSHFLPQGQKLLADLEQLKGNMSHFLAEVFYPDTVEEWICVHIDPKVEEVRKIVQNAENQLQLGARPKDFSDT